VQLIILLISIKVCTAQIQKVLNFGLHSALKAQTRGLGRSISDPGHAHNTVFFRDHWPCLQSWIKTPHYNSLKNSCLFSAWPVSRGTIPWPRWLHWPQWPWALERWLSDNTSLSVATVRDYRGWPIDLHQMWHMCVRLRPSLRPIECHWVCSTCACVHTYIFFNSKKVCFKGKASLRRRSVG